MRSRRERLVLGLLTMVLGLLVIAFPRAAAGTETSAAPTDEPTTESTVDPTGDPTGDPTAVEVDDAVLRWGMSNEANNRAPNGAFNFFSAGAAAKPAAAEMSQAEWKAAQGDVRVEKWNGSIYRPATWAGLRTDASGVEISSFQSGRYSGHQYVFSGGSGVVDPEAGTAHVAWTGSVSVLFYGGAVLYRITDPELDVRADGTGVLTGTVSGVGSSRDNPGESFEIEPERVTLADLPDVDLGLDGFNAEPAYTGVKVTVAGQQVTDSFPQSFISVMDKLGTAPFWHRSGGLLDNAKRAQPLTVSYDASTPVDQEPPPTATPNPEVENSAPPAPGVVTETVTRTVTQPVPPQLVPPAAQPPVAAPIAADLPMAGPMAETLLASSPTSADGSDAALWWAGGLLLALAALVLTSALLIPVPAPGRDIA